LKFTNHKKVNLPGYTGYRSHRHFMLWWDSLNCHGFVFFPTLAPTVALPDSTVRFPSVLHSTAAV
jgi:hypothetical protein